MQTVTIADSAAAALAGSIERLRPASVHIVTDTNVAPMAARLLPGAPLTAIAPGDVAKTLPTAMIVWEALARDGATRRSLVVNVGGGVVTDLGGFVAATFKRGVPFINVPTTVLGAVDAAVGGKTGVNFNGLKNEVGAFAPAVEVILSPEFFLSLPERELLSGFGEVLKHSLLTSRRALAATLEVDPRDAAAIFPVVAESVKVKEQIVEADPREQGVRRALNLGHTAGHAIESLSLSRGKPVAHGYAVAWGIVVALVLSHMLRGFDSALLHSVASFVRNHYGTPPIGCDDYPELLALMDHDKKNPAVGRIAFTLLDDVGSPQCGQIVDRTTITAALDIARDCLQ